MKTARTLIIFFFLVSSTFLPLNTALSDIFLQPKIVHYKNILKKLTTAYLISTAAIGTYLFIKPHHHREEFSDN
jgi:hypothetical protein